MNAKSSEEGAEKQWRRSRVMRNITAECFKANKINPRVEMKCFFT